MSTTLHALLVNLLSGGPLSPVQQNVVVDALACFHDDDASSLLQKMTDLTPPAEWTDKTVAALRASSSPYRRLDAWTKAAHRCTPADWEAAARTETSVPVRGRLLEVAPATASRAAIEALVDVTTLEDEFTYPVNVLASDLLRRLPHRLGWAATELIAHLARTQDTDCIPYILTLDLPAEVARAAMTDERIAPIHRVVLAANPTAPAGLVRPALERLAQAAASTTLTDSEELESYWVRAALTQSFNALLDVPLGRKDDRDAIIEFMPATDGTLAQVLVDVSTSLDEAEEASAEQLVVDLLLLSTTRQVGNERRAEMLWDLLPEQDRTHRVCMQMVKRSPRTARAAIAHLGEDAYDVLAQAGMVDTPFNREPAARWLRTVAPDIWMAEMRLNQQAELVLEQLTLWPECPGDDIDAVLAENSAAREMVAADLAAHPEDWHPTAALAAFEVLDTSEIENLPVEVVALAAAQLNPNARAAVWSTLARVSESTGSGSAPSQSTSRFLAVAALVSGNVALRDLPQALHV